MEEPQRKPRTTMREIGVIGLFLLLLAGIVGAFLLVTRESSRRTVCAANLKGICTGMYFRSQDPDDDWIVPPHMPATRDDVGNVIYAPHKIGLRRGSATQPDAGAPTEKDTELSTTRSLWFLVRAGSSTPLSFTCPSSDDRPNNDANPERYWDFAKYSETSYGYQVPFGRKGAPSSDREARMPLVADKGPYGAALEAGAPHTGLPPDPATIKEERDWRPWNSPNHGGTGQVVLLPDGHADFVTTPACGVKRDNIYTRWASAEAGKEENLLQRAQGTPPTGIETPYSDTDTLIYP